MRFCVVMPVAAVAPGAPAQSLALNDGWWVATPANEGLPGGPRAPVWSRLKRMYLYTMCKPIKKNCQNGLVRRASPWARSVSACWRCNRSCGRPARIAFDAPVQPPPIRWCALEEVSERTRRKSAFCPPPGLGEGNGSRSLAWQC